MIGLSEFFKKIQSVYSRQILVRSEIRKAIMKNTGADVPIEEIQVKNSVATIRNASQSLRSAIYIKKIQIIEDLRLTDGGRTISDIR